MSPALGRACDQFRGVRRGLCPWPVPGRSIGVFFSLWGKGGQLGAGLALLFPHQICRLTSLDSHPTSSGGEPRGTHCSASYLLRKHWTWLSHTNPQGHRPPGSTPGGVPSSLAWKMLKAGVSRYPHPTNLPRKNSRMFARPAHTSWYVLWVHCLRNERHHSPMKCEADSW